MRRVRQLVWRNIRLFRVRQKISKYRRINVTDIQARTAGMTLQDSALQVGKLPSHRVNSFQFDSTILNVSSHQKKGMRGQHLHKPSAQSWGVEKLYS